MLRTSVKLAHEQQRVVIFLEPIALYMTKDLHEEGDGLWTFPYLSPKANENNDKNALSVKVAGEGEDLCILTYGNGYYLSRQAQKILTKQGINCRVIDLRWLAPLDEQGIIEQVNACKKVLIVDECRQTGSISEALMSLILEQSMEKNYSDIQRLCAKDSFIPLGSAAYHVLPSKDDIVNCAIDLCQLNKS